MIRLFQQSWDENIRPAVPTESPKRQTQPMTVKVVGSADAVVKTQWAIQIHSGSDESSCYVTLRTHTHKHTLTHTHTHSHLTMYKITHTPSVSRTYKHNTHTHTLKTDTIRSYKDISACCDVWYFEYLNEVGFEWVDLINWEWQEQTFVE